VTDEPTTAASTPDSSDEPSVFAQGARYVLVGGTSAALELGIFWVLHHPVHFDVRLSNIIAVVIATVFNFILNRTWTFNATSHVMRSAVLYLIIWSLNLLFTTSVIYFANKHGFSPDIAKFFTMALVTLWNFQLWRKVVFV